MNTIYHIHFVVNTIMKSLWPFPKEADLLLKLNYYKQIRYQANPFGSSNTAFCITDTSPSTTDPNNINIYDHMEETIVSSSKQNIKSQGLPFAIVCHLLDKSFISARCQRDEAGEEMENRLN